MSSQAADLGSEERGSGIVLNDIGTSYDELMAAIDATIKPFKDGDLVSGTIVKIDKEEVLVDIGYKSEGVIPARELSIRNDVDPSQIVSMGEQIEALVLQKEDKEGRLILSKKRASYERAWGRIEDIKRAGGVVNGTVIEVVKGGLIVDIGLRGFLPASLVDLRRVRDLQSLVGKEIECKIIELDKNRNNVVLSRRAFLEETHSEQRKEFLEALKPGEKRTGVVSSIVNFGAFVDLGGVDGLVHVSELSWRHVDHPSEVVQVGQEIEVEILSVEMDRDRVSLSLKNTQEDPWQAFARTNNAGDVVKGTVTKLVPFGAFVQVAEGIEGLVHISELSDAHVELPDQVVQLGQEVDVKIIDVDLERRRISLSLKQALPGMIPIYAPSAGESEIRKEAEASAAPAPELEDSTEGDMVKEEPPAPAEEKSAEIQAAEPAADEDVVEEIPPSEPEAKAADEATEEVTPEAEPGTADEAAEEVTPEPELEGEMLESAQVESDESLESIVEEMKKDRG